MSNGKVEIQNQGIASTQFSTHKKKQVFVCLKEEKYN